VLEAELPLHLELDRQAVTVPAGLARDEVAAHGLVAREDVLEDARQDVVGAGTSVGGGRALVEEERLGALAAPNRLVEDVALAPPLEHALFELGKGLRWIYLPIAGHEQEDDIPPVLVLNLRGESPNRARIGPGADGGPK
jgi:hypothetical protein